MTSTRTKASSRLLQLAGCGAFGDSEVLWPDDGSLCPCRSIALTETPGRSVQRAAPDPLPIASSRYVARVASACEPRCGPCRRWQCPVGRSGANLLWARRTAGRRRWTEQGWPRDEVGARWAGVEGTRKKTQKMQTQCDRSIQLDGHWAVGEINVFIYGPLGSLFC